MKTQFDRREATVIALTALLALVPLVLIAGYLYSKQQWADSKISEVSPRYARLTGLIANKGNLLQASDMAGAQVFAYVYPSAQDAVQIGNEVQQKMRGVLSSAGLTVVSSQVMPVKDSKDDKEFERIPLTVRAEGELLAVYLAIAAMSEQKPAVLLDSLSVQTSGVPLKGVQRMAVQLNLLVLRARK